MGRPWVDLPARLTERKKVQLRDRVLSSMISVISRDLSWTAGSMYAMYTTLLYWYRQWIGGWWETCGEELRMNHVGGRVETLELG